MDKLRNSTIRTRIAALGIAAACALAASPVQAANCGGDFSIWLSDFKRDAAANGVSQRTIASALSGITPDPHVLSRDRGQRVFRQSFEQFSGRMISPDRMRKGKAMLARHASLFQRIEQRYGVPGPVIVAIWGLETDYGVNGGKLSIVRSTATLAHDCRRSDKFRGELMDSLRIIDRGDMASAELRGDWAGEIGQMQFLPSSYLKFAVDFDGNGKRDLIHSVPDVLASTANYLKSYGWQRGQGWDEGSANFTVLAEWNKAQVYRKTIAAFADRLAGE